MEVGDWTTEALDAPQHPTTFDVEPADVKRTQTDLPDPIVGISIPDARAKIIDLAQFIADGELDFYVTVHTLVAETIEATMTRHGGGLQKTGLAAAAYALGLSRWAIRRFLNGQSAMLRFDRLAARR